MRNARFVIAMLVTVLALTGLLIWGFLAGRSEAAAGARSEQPVTPAVQVRPNPLGPPTLIVAPELQREAGIQVAGARAAPYRRHIEAYGSVLGLQPLTAIANTLASANAQRSIAEAKVATSRAALHRARLLFKDDQNFSRAQLQAAEAAYDSDEASLRAAEVQARNAAAEAFEAWGPVIGRSLASDGALAESLLQRHRLLIQVTLPLGVSMRQTPRTAAMETPAGKPVSAELVSLAVSTDPRIQGTSYFFTASAAAGLLPGMSVIALLPAGNAAQGISIPASAVIWLDGRAWVYLRSGGNSFTRREISTAQPQPDGGYVVASRFVPAGAALVTTGAEALLSQEFSAEINVSD
jgi:hypothetical protein